jgi:hypothetical protein
MFTLRKKVDDGISCLSCFTLRKKVDEEISCLSCFSYIIARINDGCLVISRNSFANTWVHSRCFGGSVLLILCEHLGSFPVFWWIRVAHPLRAHGFIPGVLVDPCCSSFASTWVHSRFFFWIRVAHPCFVRLRSVFCSEYCLCLWIVITCLALRFSLTFIYFLMR